MRMRTAPALLIAIMCLSLLTMQMSGLHLHVSVDSQSGALHGTHLHDAALGEHGRDHDAEIDVSSFEPGVAWSKLIPILVALILLCIITSLYIYIVSMLKLANLSLCHNDCDGHASIHLTSLRPPTCQFIHTVAKSTSSEGHPT